MNIGWRHQRMQQQTQCIDENVALLAVIINDEFLAAVEKAGIPPAGMTNLTREVAADDCVAFISALRREGA